MKEIKIGDILKCESSLSDYFTVNSSYTVVSDILNNMSLINDNGVIVKIINQNGKITSLGELTTFIHDEDRIDYKIGEMLTCVATDVLYFTLNREYPIEALTIDIHGIRNLEIGDDEGVSVIINIDSTDECSVFSDKSVAFIKTSKFNDMKSPNGIMKRLIERHGSHIAKTSNKSYAYARSYNNFNLIIKEADGKWLDSTGMHWEFAIPCNAFGKEITELSEIK